MERKIANIDEFQMDENETPILPTGLREEENLYVLPTASPPLRGLPDRRWPFDHL